jgi:hypothetical protein
MTLHTPATLPPIAGRTSHTHPIQAQLATALHHNTLPTPNERKPRLIITARAEELRARDLRAAVGAGREVARGGAGALLALGEGGVEGEARHAGCAAVVGGA